MIQSIPYRDKYGYLRRAGELSEPKLIFCPMTNGLRVLKKCKKCDFRKRANAVAVQCKFPKECKPPYYYNRLNPHNYDNVTSTARADGEAADRQN